MSGCGCDGDGCGCNCGCGCHDHGEGDEKMFGTRMVAGGVLFAAGLLMHLVLGSPVWMQLPVFLAGYIVVGYDVVLDAFRGVLRGHVLDENFLMFIASAGAFAIGEFPEAVAVMLFFQVGEWFEHRAVRRTRESISALMDLQSDRANLLVDGHVERVHPSEVPVGARIVVRPGERVPLDGTVTEGCSTLDTSALTGEPLPRDVSPGSVVESGTVNLSSRIVLEVSLPHHDSTVSRLLRLVEESVARKAPVERFITRFARWYTPAVVLAALLVATVPICLGHDPVTWVYRALTFLVVSCPCALVVSIPLSYYCGIGAGSRLGILLKGGNYLEALSRVDTVVFDKTGTLTEGRFRVASVDPVSVTADELLRTAAVAESSSNHPIALSVVEASGTRDDHPVERYTEHPGRGVEAVSGGRTILAGNRAMMMEHGIACNRDGDSGTTVHVAVDGTYIGSITLDDSPKADAAEAVSSLAACGVRRTVMLSGDSPDVCRRVGDALGVDEVHGGLMPGDKTRILEDVISGSRGTVAFVGDGINDAPSLARADIGIAMGGLGSDAAIEAADMVIMDDSPSRIATAIRLSRRVRGIVVQNIVFALGAKVLIMVLAAAGAVGMWAAVFGDVGVAAIAVLNAARCLDTGAVSGRRER